MTNLTIQASSKPALYLTKEESELLNLYSTLLDIKARFSKPGSIILVLKIHSSITESGFKLIVSVNVNGELRKRPPFDYSITGISAAIKHVFNCLSSDKDVTPQGVKAA